MIILPLDLALVEYLRKRKLLKKFEKQKIIFEQNPFYPGLNTELLLNSSAVEVVDVNNHYGG